MTGDARQVRAFRRRASRVVRRTVAITGCSRGLGRALAKAFAAHGLVVVGCSRTAADLESLASELGPPHDFRRVDVTCAEVDDWAASVIRSHGSPDLLLNCAALINRVTELWKVPPEELEAVVDVNVKGVFRVLRAFLPAMIERGSGVVVNFSSGWGRTTAPGVAPYCATKFAVEGLTRALAKELPRGLAAVALNPGVVDTEMLRIAWAERAADYPKPEQWAEPAVRFLLALGPEDNGESLSVPSVAGTTFG